MGHATLKDVFTWFGIKKWSKYYSASTAGMEENDHVLNNSTDDTNYEILSSEIFFLKE